jgi:hypothetical protein
MIEQGKRQSDGEHEQHGATATAVRQFEARTPNTQAIMHRIKQARVSMASTTYTDTYIVHTSSVKPFALIHFSYIWSLGPLRRYSVASTNEHSGMPRHRTLNSHHWRV